MIEVKANLQPHGHKKQRGPMLLNLGALPREPGPAHIAYAQPEEDTNLTLIYIAIGPTHLIPTALTGEDIKWHTSRLDFVTSHGLRHYIRVKHSKRSPHPWAYGRYQGTLEEGRSPKDRLLWTLIRLVALDPKPVHTVATTSPAVITPPEDFTPDERRIFNP